MIRRRLRLLAVAMVAIAVGLVGVRALARSRTVQLFGTVVSRVP